MDLTTTPPRPPRTQTPATVGTLAGPVTQCPKCHARIARDQRYCVDCGQRLSEARPPLMREGGLRAAATAPAPELPVSTPPRARLSQTALVAGVGTLILAMGVGVLIGKGNTPATPTIQGYVPGVAATTASAPAATTPTTPVDDAAASADDAKASKAQDAKAKKLAKEAAAAGGSVITSDSSKPLPKKVTLGSKGSGKGYDKNGEFTGDFFGP